MSSGRKADCTPPPRPPSRSKAPRRDSDTRYRLLFEANPSPLYVFAEESLKLLAVNDAMVRQYGWSREEFLKMKATDLRPAVEVPRFLEALEGQRGANASFVGEWRHQREDGSGFDAEVTVSCLNYEGRPARLVLVNDITARKQAEAALRRGEQHYRSLYDNNLSGVFRVDSRGRFLDANPAATRMCGYSVEELRERTFMDLCVPECRAETSAAFRDGMAGKPHDLTTAMTRKDGQRVDLLLSGAPVVIDDRTTGLFCMALDITARKKAEDALARLNATLEQQVVERTRALRDSEANFRGYFENVGVGAAQINAEGRFIRVNDRYCAITGYSREELLGGMRPLDLDHPDDRELDRKAIGRLLKGTAYELEKRYVAKDGRTVWVHITVSPILDAKGRFLRSAAVIEDITARQQAKTALAESERHLRAIVDAAPDGILALDEQGQIQSVNPAGLNLFGYGLEEIVGQNISRLLTLSAKTSPAEFLAQYVSEGNDPVLVHPREVVARGKSGESMLVELILTPFAHAGRRGFVAMVHDITQRKRLEQELVEVSERERQSVGRELHDELGQILHGVHFLATDLGARLRRQGVAEAGEVDRMTHFLDEALEATRRMARGLQPVPPVPEGLMKSLRELAVRIREIYGVSCRFSCREPVLVTDPVVAMHLFRIAQEATTNAVKHSRCKRIFIRLRAAPRRLILGVRDDGHARFPAAKRRRGMGLHVMQFRAGAINGSLVVYRRPQSGTEVICTVEPFHGYASNPKKRRSKKHVE